MSQHLAAVAAGDINRLAAMGGLLKLEVDALRFGPNLHGHDVQRRHPSGDPLALVERACVVFDAIVAGLTCRRWPGSLARSVCRARVGVAAASTAAAWPALSTRPLRALSVAAIRFGADGRAASFADASAFAFSGFMAALGALTFLARPRRGRQTGDQRQNDPSRHAIFGVLSSAT